MANAIRILEEKHYGLEIQAQTTQKNYYDMSR